MILLMACGTWIDKNKWNDTVINYIYSCDIFPNITMIAEATGFPEQCVKFTLSMLKKQEEMRVSRGMLFENETGTKSRKDILIHRLMEEADETIPSFTNKEDARKYILAFMEANRYYDENGEIHYRFTEEEVTNSLKEHRYIKDV